MCDTSFRFSFRIGTPTAVQGCLCVAGGRRWGPTSRAIEERQVDGFVVKGGADGEQDAGRAGGQVHREPHQLLAGEGEVATVRHRMPGEPAYLLGQPRGGTAHAAARPV